jgi:hypothetical protein
MRLAGVSRIEQANRFLQEVFVPSWEQRFTVAPRQSQEAHRSLGREPPGADPECARVSGSGQRLQPALAGTSLGDPAGGGAAWIAGCSGPGREATGWQCVGALPQWLPAPGPLPGRADAFGGKSFRPTASRTRRQNQKKNQIRPSSYPSVEEDTSTWQKSGHFYFALTSPCRAWRQFGYNTSAGSCRESRRRCECRTRGNRWWESAQR